MRLLIAIPVLAVLVLFALSNTEDVPLTFWPTDITLIVPLSIAILAAMAVAFLMGALIAFVSSLGARGRARRAEYNVRLLEDEVRALKARQANVVPALPSA